MIRAHSNLSLNVSREETSLTSLGNLAQCFTTLILKNVFLICNVNLLSFNLKAVPLLIGTDPCKKLLFRFFCKLDYWNNPEQWKLNNSNPFSLSSQENCSSPLYWLLVFPVLRAIRADALLWCKFNIIYVLIWNALIWNVN